MPKKYDNIKDKKSDMRFHRKWKIAVIIFCLFLYYYPTDHARYHDERAGDLLRV